MIQIIDLSKKDLKYCSSVLTLALEKDPLYIAMFPNENKRRKYLKCFFEMKIRYTLKYGELYSTSNKYESLMLLLPGDDKITRKKVFTSGGIKIMLKLGKYNMNKLINVMTYLEQKQRDCMIDEFVNLSPIVVNPMFQNKGYATSMLESLNKKLKSEDKICYLETQNPSELLFYKSFGFSIVSEGYMFINQVRYWCLKK